MGENGPTTHGRQRIVQASTDEVGDREDAIATKWGVTGLRRDRKGKQRHMLLADIGLVANAMTALNAPPDLVERIVTLLRDNSEELDGHNVTEVGGDWFGGAHTAHRLGVNTKMAHQAVEEEFQKLADSLRAYRAAITQWAEEVRDVDATTSAELTMRASALQQVNDTLDSARDEAVSTSIGDGRYTEPSTEGDS